MAATRWISIPGYVLAWLLCVGMAPVWIPLAAFFDLVRRSRGVALRSGAFLTLYFSLEMVGLLATAALLAWRWLRAPEREHWEAVHFRLEAWWGHALFRSAQRAFGIRLVVEEDAELGRGPYVLLMRHVSTADTLLTSALVSWSHGMRIRYVLKRELLWDPCLDIVGNRIPNAFVDRSSIDTQAEIQRVRALARDLGPRDGILIYPEGTRSTPEKRARVLAAFERDRDDAMRAYGESLQNVLPPRPGGTLAVLEAAPHADVVFCSHSGFEDVASLGAIWNGALVDRTVRVQLRRVPFEAIPKTRDDRWRWLLDEWRQVDAWVAAANVDPDRSIR